MPSSSAPSGACSASQPRRAEVSAMDTRAVYLRDAWAESLLSHAGRSAAASELLAALRDGAAPPGDRPGPADAAGRRPRVAVRGLTGSARGFLVAWLQRELARP